MNLSFLGKLLQLPAINDNESDKYGPHTYLHASHGRRIMSPQIYSCSHCRAHPYSCDIHVPRGHRRRCRWVDVMWGLASHADKQVLAA